MKLINTTKLPDLFLRRMTAWCCKEVGLPVRMLKEAVFRNRTDGSRSGHAYLERNRIVCSCTASLETGDNLWTLVELTAHEVAHIWAYRIKKDRGRGYGGSVGGGAEEYIERIGRKVANSFAANQQALIDEWSAIPDRMAAYPAKSTADRNQERRRELLAKWDRKLKLAKTKVAKLTRAIRQADNRLAKPKPAGEPKARKPRAASCKQQAETLAKEIGAECYKENGTIWVYPPNGLYEDEGGPADPYEDEHCRDTWQDALEAVKAYQAEVVGRASND